MTDAQAVRELLSHEEIRDTYNQISEKMNDNRSGSLYKIWVPKDDSITNKEAIYAENNMTEINERVKLGEKFFSGTENNLDKPRTLRLGTLRWEAN